MKTQARLLFINRSIYLNNTINSTNEQALQMGHSQGTCKAQIAPISNEAWLQIERLNIAQMTFD